MPSCSSCGRACLGLVLASAPLHAVLAAPDLVAPRHGTADIVLRAAQPYNGAQGTPNPFTGVSFQLQVTSPTGRTIAVPGFFDGDGQGSQAGDVFVARVYANEPGTWSWTASSSDAGLHGQSGSFQVSGSLPGRWGHGALVTRASVPRHFTHWDGTPIFLAGKFLDDAASGRAARSHPMFSETWSDADRRALLDRAASLSLDKIAVYLANVGDYDAQPTTPWLGTSGSNDKTRFDLARWHAYERWVRTMRDEGYAVQLWMFADDSGFGELPESDRERLIAYAMARLSAYANTSFVLALEWEEGFSVAEVDAHAAFLQSKNPWRWLMSVHGRDGVFDFPTRPWATFMAIQSGLHQDHAGTHATNLANRALAVKPSVDEELAFGLEDLPSRQKTWSAFTAGAATLGTGAGFQALMTLVGQLEFERMAPDDALVVTGNATVLAERGRAYVAYLPEGGSVRLDLTHASGSFEARWLDPRTGGFLAQGTVQGGASVTFASPGALDWTLHLRRTCSTGFPPRIGGVRLAKDGTISWGAHASAGGYDVVMGDLAALRAGGLQGSLRGCVERNGGGATALDPEVPGPGGGRYYLVRSRHCSGATGTFDEVAGAQEGSRDAPAAASGNDCP